MRYKKIWYIRVDDETEGPYSVYDLKSDNRVTLKTLAWKKGMAVWLPIEEIPELKVLFEEEDDFYGKYGGGESVLTFQESRLPPTWFMIVAIVILTLLFFLYWP